MCSVSRLDRDARFYDLMSETRKIISTLPPPHPPPPTSFVLLEQETAEERWRPILGVEGIIVSVISMLSDPNDESPANIDAAVMWRSDKDAFKKKSRLLVRKSQDAL